MANATVKFDRFKWNPGGYKAVKNSSGVQSLLNRKAEAVRGSANSSQDGYAHKTVPGRLAGDTLHVVYPTTFDSAQDNLKNNTLQKSIGAAQNA